MNCNYLVNDSWYPAYPYPTDPDSTTLPNLYIALAAVLSVVFPLSFIGTVLNIVFICRKKTNFLARRIVYITVVTTLQLGALWFWNIPAFKRDDSWYQFCIYSATLYMSAATVSLWMMAILVCSIHFSLVSQLYGCSCCFSRRLPWSDRSCFRLEVFLVITLLIGLVFGVLTYNIITSFRLITDIDKATLYFFLLPLAIVAISAIGIIILIYIWCRTLRRKQITKRRAEAVLIRKEVLLLKLLLFFIGYFITSPWFPAVGQIIVATFISSFPFLFFGCYMYYSFRSRTRHVLFANRADIEPAGSGLQTAPPSTGVSLSTDKAEHAPNRLTVNFLIPSTAEPSEVTPLIT